MPEQNKEIVDLLKSMHEDPSSTPDIVKVVEEKNKKPARKRKAKSKKEPALEPVKEEEPKPEEAQQTQYSASFEAEPLFDDEPKHDAPMQFMVGDELVKITDEDKDLYLKAVLNDVPLKLTIDLVGGQAHVECRALTPYERNLVPYAVKEYFVSRGGDQVGAAFMLDYARQFMMAMQVVSINGKQEPKIEFVSGGGSTQEEHIKDLATRGKEKCDNYNMAKYNLLIKALNIFENKLARLNTAALKQDFWGPADAD